MNTRLQRASFYWRILLSLLVLTCLLPVPSSAAQSRDESYNIVIVIDESSSMWDHSDVEIRQVSDPVHQNILTDTNTGLPLYKRPAARVQAAEALLSVMSAEPSNAHFNVALVTFGTQVYTASGLSPVKDAGDLEAKIRSLSQAHVKYEGKAEFTDTYKALDQADTLLFGSGAPAASKKVVLMITDGKPETRENQNNAQLHQTYMNSVRDKIRTLTDRQVEFISFLLDVNPPSDYVNDKDRAFWQGISSSQGSNLTCDYQELRSPQELFVRTQNIIGCILSGDIKDLPDHTATIATKGLYPVENYIREISITIIKNDPNTQVRISRPGGVPIPLSGDDHGDQITHSAFDLTESYRIEHSAQAGGPWAGCWEVSITQATEQNAQVKFVVVPYSEDYNLRFTEPNKSVWPVGKPLPLQVQLFNSAQAMVEPATLNARASLPVNIARPVGAETLPLDLHNAAYTGKYSADTPGVYTFTTQLDLANIHQRGKETEQCRDLRVPAEVSGQLTGQSIVAMQKLPWLDLVSPQAGSTVGTSDFLIQARLMYGTKPDNGLLQGSIKAQLSTDNGGGKQTFGLVPDRATPGLYHGRLPGQVDSGDYHLTVNFSGTSPDLGTDTILSDTVQADIHLIAQGLPSPTDTPVPPTATLVPPTATAVPPTATAILPTATPLPATPAPIPPAPRNDDFPWGLVLGALVLAALVGAALWAASQRRNGADLTGMTLSPLGGGRFISLRGRNQMVTLGGAKLKFTPVADGASMTVISAADPVLVNGISYGPTESAMLNEGTTLEVGGDSYTVMGRPRGKGSGGFDPDAIS